MQRVLNVAEKPSVAKDGARILSGGNVQRHNGASQYHLTGTSPTSWASPVQHVNLRGRHLTELESPASHKGWRTCSPPELFATPVYKTAPGVSHWQCSQKQLTPGPCVLSCVRHTYRLPEGRPWFA